MKLTLDYNNWICGLPLSNPNKHCYLGVGSTKLLNDQGFMCCLGQFALQLGATKSNILNKNDPESIFLEINLPLLRVDKENYNKGIDFYKTKNSDFSKECMIINDDENTTIKTKVEKLKNICNNHGIELELVNFPSYILV